jgi:glycosyltransferase involved in cell wall biosynthesis
VDLAPWTVLHHSLMGCERVWVIDNGSTDGTYEALQGLAAHLRNLRVDRDNGPFDQARMTSDMANALVREGFELIIPFDADECWHASIGGIARQLRRREANALSVPVVNYIQSRAVRQAEPGCWRTATRRVPRAINPQVHIADAVGTQRISFVEKAFARKVLAAPPRGSTVHFVKGNHNVRFDGAKVAQIRVLPCLHLPLRAASELEKRVVDYRDRHAPFRIDGAGWRLDYWAELLGSGRIEAEWAANSYDEEGMIDVYGQKRSTIIDRRLVRHLQRAERFRAAIETTGGKAWLPLRFVFRVRAPRFRVPKNILGLQHLEDR